MDISTLERRFAFENIFTPLHGCWPQFYASLILTTTLPNWRHRIMKLKTALFISLKVIALTVILFICFAVAGGVVGL